MRTLLVSLVALIGLITVPKCHGHGRMMQPPARNSMWRLGYPTKQNKDDGGVYCGGFDVQWKKNNGSCGVCGDAFNGPREHETGGCYASNITVGNYDPGSVVDIRIEILKNHGGAFSFAMCWRDKFIQREYEGCFKPLPLADGSLEYPLKLQSGPGNHTMKVQLPKTLKGDKSILRWHWKTGDKTAKCKDGSTKLGCGPQTTYRNCADISVTSK